MSLFKKKDPADTAETVEPSETTEQTDTTVETTMEANVRENGNAADVNHDSRAGACLPPENEQRQQVNVEPAESASPVSPAEESPTMNEAESRGVMSRPAESALAPASAPVFDTADALTDAQLAAIHNRVLRGEIIEL